MKVIGFTGSEEGSFIKTWRTLGRMAADIEGLPAFSGGILALAPAVAPPPPSPPLPSLNPSGLEFMLAKPEWVGVYASSSAGGFEAAGSRVRPSTVGRIVFLVTRDWSLNSVSAGD